MKIALFITGHLRNNPIDCIESIQNYIYKNYTKDLDLYIDTYDSLGVVDKEKKYDSIEFDWFEKKNQKELVQQYLNQLNPDFYNIDDFETFQSELVIPKIKFIEKSLNKKNIAIKNPGLLKSFISQTIKRNQLISNINNLNGYDYIFMTRADVNFENLPKLNLNNKFNFFQSQEFRGKNRAVFSFRYRFIENLYEEDKLSKYSFFEKFKKKILLTDDICFIARSEIISEFQNNISNNIEKNILNLNLKQYQFLKWTEKDIPAFGNLPNWEMPEFLLSILLNNRIKTHKYGVFKLNNKNNLRQFEFFKLVENIS